MLLDDSNYLKELNIALSLIDQPIIEEIVVLLRSIINRGDAILFHEAGKRLLIQDRIASWFPHRDNYENDRFIRIPTMPPDTLHRVRLTGRDGAVIVVSTGKNLSRAVTVMRDAKRAGLDVIALCRSIDSDDGELRHFANFVLPLASKESHIIADLTAIVLRDILTRLGIHMQSRFVND